MSGAAPSIGITGPSGLWSPGWLCAARAVRRAGGRPLRLTPKRQRPGRGLDGLIIGGGADISPALYHELEAPGRRLDPARDEFELSALHRALDDGLPILGICRGAQLLNVALGGTLYRDIRDRRRHPPARPTLRARRPITLRPGSRLARLIGRRRIRVNSLHRQAVHRMGRGLRAVARDSDYIVQAIEAADDRPVLGLQWHPEYLFRRPDQARLFADLVNRCR